jgi:hypothetical protein
MDALRCSSAFAVSTKTRIVPADGLTRARARSNGARALHRGLGPIAKKIEPKMPRPSLGMLMLSHAP